VIKVKESDRLTGLAAYSAACDDDFMAKKFLDRARCYKQKKEWTPPVLLGTINVLNAQGDPSHGEYARDFMEIV